MGKFQEALFDDLSLYVRQSAWLNAIPERAKNDKSEAPRISRLEEIRKARNDGEFEPEMPPAGAAEYLIVYLWEVGPTMVVGGHAAQVTHVELRAWMDLTGLELEPWEVRFLRRLSGEYLGELYRAEKRECPAPSRQQTGARDLVAVAMGLKAALEEMAKR